MRKTNMKTKEVVGILMLFLCGFSFISCDKDKEDVNLFPEGTSTLRMMNEENGKTILGNSDVYITKEGNFKSGQFPIFDMGEKKGIQDIAMPNFVNMAPEVAVNLKHGYVLCNDRDVYTFDSQKKAIIENAQVYRIFVDSWIQDKEENITGANVYFLLGTPMEHGQMPAYDSNIGSLSWNYDLGKTNILNLAIPSSNPNDIEIEFITEGGDEYIAYSINKNSISFSLKVAHIWATDYRLRIRCNRVYTEVILTLIDN